jgi:predicted transglutaminase-like cysteine proteinase
MVATAFADPVALGITSYQRPKDLLKTANRIRFDVPVLAPVAFVRFCLKYPRDCEIRRMAFRPSLTRERVNELIKVNRAINVAIAPEEDHGRVDQEQWLLSPHAGDCNDYAVSKRHELLARGWPSHSVLLAEVVVTAIGKHHLVLVVRTREGDFILDNLYQDIRPVSQTPYKWVRAQQQKNPRFWSTVSPARTEEIVMNVR